MPWLLNHIFKALKAYGQNCLYLDRRSLALFRIGLGTLILCDLWNRLPSVRAFLSDAGVLSRRDLLTNWNASHSFSLYLANGSEYFCYFMMAVTASAAFCLIIGYRTKLMTAICWVLVVSLQLRNPLVLQGGDDLLKLLLFWSIFLPLDNTALVKKIPHKVTGIRPIALLAQVVLLYTFAGLLKTGVEWQVTGNAVYYALHLDHFATPIGMWLRQFPDFLRVVTAATLKLEVFGPILFLMPWKNAWFRMIGILAFAGLHLGFIFTMRLGLFPFIDLVALIPILPSLFWNKIIRLNPSEIEVNEPGSSNKILSYFTNAFVALCLSIAVLSNFEKTHKPFQMYKPLKVTGETLRVTQNWGMFAPRPMKDDGWFILHGTLENDKEIDVFRMQEGPRDHSKPAVVSSFYPSQRWRKYLMNIYKNKHKQHRLHLGRFLCRENNRLRNDPFQKLTNLKITYMLERSPAPRTKARPVEEKELWNHNCFPKPMHMQSQTKQKTAH